MAKPRTPVEILGLALGFVLVFSLFPIAGAPQAPSTAGSAVGQQPSVDVPADRGSRNLQGSDAADVLEGSEGNDTLDGGGGDDWLFGEAGDDLLRGGEGSDTLDGGPGRDVLIGGAGPDLLDGGEAAVDNVPDNNILLGGEGNDTLRAGDGGALLMDGGPGDDDLFGGRFMRGGEGDDTLRVLGGAVILEGGPGNDSLFGADADEILRGGPGDDLLEGRDGNDWLIGGADTDLLDGGDGDDTLDGGEGDDTLIAGDGDDTLEGRGGHDRLHGGNGQDILTGGPGDDWLLGGLGLDRTIGGADNDVILLRSGDVGSDEQELIDGDTGSDTLILNGFINADLPEPRAASAEPGARAWFVLTDPVTGGAYHVLNVEQIQHAHLFTQVGAGRNVTTSFLFVNPSTTTTSSGSVAFYGDEGAPLALSIGGEPAQPNFAFSVPPMGTLEFDASGPSDLVTGSAQVLVDNPLGGIVRAVFPGADIASVGEGKLMDRFMVPIIEDAAAGLSSGVAIFNGDLDGVKLTLYTPDGRQGPEAVIDLPASGHRVLFVSEAFPGVGNFRGAMMVEAGHARSHENSQLAGVGVHRGPGPNQLTTFPVIPVALPVPETLQFARFTSGGNSASALFLINPSAAVQATGTLDFFDEDGEPWEVPVNGLNPTASVPFDILPRGSAVFTTPAEGRLAVVSARVTMTEGAVGAVMRFALSGEGVASVGASPAFTGFVTPVARNRQRGVNTEVGLTSTGSPVTLTLELRDAGGTTVPGGTARLALPANGRLARTIDALFPDADTDDFRGTVTVRADGDTVAASVMQVGGDPVAIAVMPVAPLR